MAELAAVNASPLIFLAHAGILDFLRFAAPEIVVPVAVAEEIRRRGPGEPTARAIQGIKWLREVETSPPPPAVLAWHLGPGESSVLAWCLEHPGSETIVDDLSDRFFAMASERAFPSRTCAGRWR